jgi:hypothetical protein
VTSRSVLRDVSDGGLSADHAKRSLPIVVAPTTTDDSNTIRPGLRTIACWRLDDPRFGFDASFIEQPAAEEFAALASLTSSHSNAPLSVFGHADLTGNDDYNKTLSGRRAESVYAVITRRVDMWEALFLHPHGHDQWGTKHVQQMLIAVGFFDGPPGDKLTPIAKDSVRAYQAARDLAVDGDAGPNTRAKLIAEYMDTICRSADGKPFSLPKERFLAQGADPKGKGDFQGCGEFNPVFVFTEDERRQFAKPENKPARDKANAPNRRILVYLFEPNTVVTADKWPCPRTREGVGDCKKRFWSDADERRRFGDAERRFEKHRNTFACRFYHGLAMRSVCETLRGAKRVTVNLVDPFGNALPLQSCLFLVGDAQDAEKKAVTDSIGNAAAVLPEGAIGVLLPDGSFGLLRGGEVPFDFARHAPPGSGSEEVSSNARSVDEDGPWPEILDAIGDLHGRYADTSPSDLNLTGKG